MFKWLAGVVFALFLMMGTAHAATTYYIDYTNGSDTNNGTSKATPWKHAPGMNGCSSNCASYTGTGGGDTWILKGCVTWPAASLPWAPVYSEEIAEVNTGGLDQTWWDNTVSGCATSWNRPILDAQDTILSPNTVANFTSFGINIYYVEFRGGTFNNSSQPGTIPVYLNFSEFGNQTADHVYMHDVKLQAGATNDTCALITGSGGDNTSPGNIITNSVFDLTDSLQNIMGTNYTSCYAIFTNVQKIENNVIINVSNGVVTAGPPDGMGSMVVDGNNIENIGPDFQYQPGGPGEYHGNCYEDNGSLTNAYFYNNICAHLSTGVLGWWFAPVPGVTTYAWNNILWDTQATNVIDLSTALGQTSNGSFSLYNNTVECGPDSGPTSLCNGNFAAIASTLTNNHFITSASPAFNCSSGGTQNCTNTTNLVQSQSTANGQGYSSSETYVFSPTSNSGSTVGAGTNLTTTATGALASLANDTSYACSEVSSPYITVSCPSRSQNPRPSSGNWDIGAYQYPSSSAPGAPSSVSGTNGGSVGAHTVTVTWSPSITSGATYFIYRGATSGGESNTPLNMSGVGTSCTSPSGGCTYTDSTVIAGQTLYYIVKAMTGSGFSVASNEINMVVPVSAPTGLVITGVH